MKLKREQIRRGTYWADLAVGFAVGFLLALAVCNKASGQATSYGFYEQGKREPGIEKIKKICQFLNVSADYLFGLSDDPTPEIKQSSDYTTDDLLAELKRRWNNYGG